MTSHNSIAYITISDCSYYAYIYNKNLYYFYTLYLKRPDMIKIHLLFPFNKPYHNLFSYFTSKSYSKIKKYDTSFNKK